MYAARLKRPTPYIDKTVYVSWNAYVRLGVSELRSRSPRSTRRSFALRSLDRILVRGVERGELD